LAFAGNFLLLAAKDNVNSWGQIIAFNGSLFFTAGLISIYAFRLWDVEVEGDVVVAIRFKKRIEFTLRDIRRIDVTPNLIMRNNGPPFVNIILISEIDGVSELKYFPSSDRKDEHLLIEPWKKVYREWAQESMKRRKARR
jgi:hypothetical protein